MRPRRIPDRGQADDAVVGVRPDPAAPTFWRWKTRPAPKPGANEILIRVHAASVNPVDYQICSGRFKAGPIHFPLILGRDVSGVVEEVGSGLRDCRSGDEVFAMLGAHSGGYAEYAVATAEEAAPKPNSLDHVHAAAVPLAALTACTARARPCSP